MTTAAAVLQTSHGEDVALKGVHVNAELTDLVSNVSITQTYQNTEETNIEAVYTFPLPLDAVLLDLTITLGDKTLQGQVVEKKQAEERYEEAITDGDSAIMLQETQPGLFTMNVGNIMAGETILIKYHYGMLHSYRGKSLRFMLPTTVAPRYGNPVQGGLEPHQVPEHTLSSGYGFSLNVTINGLLVGSDIVCPTHKVIVNSDNNEVNVTLANEVSSMDRDFVLNFNNIPNQISTAQIEKDHNGYVALASFHCNFELNEDTSPRSYKIVVDCSGSMTGDSMNQAKMALFRILDSMRDGDFINIIKFGSHYETFSEEQECINEQIRERLAGYIELINANMGGTEMNTALNATYNISNHMEMQHDVLLITDGEVWNEAELVQSAKSSHHRIFTVGVGSSVAENVVRQLAEETGGACELVTPNESMADNIHRHFQRMFAPRSKDVNITWVVTPRISSPDKITSVYAGDTLHVYGWFDNIPEGYVELQVTLPNGDTLIENSPYALNSNNRNEDYFLARMGTSHLLKHNANIDDIEKISKAIGYQLMTPWTNYLVIHKRKEGEEAEELPDIRTVPHTLSAGYGGIGSVDNMVCNMEMSYELDDAVSYCKKMPPSRSIDDDLFDSEGLGIPSFLRRSADVDVDVDVDSIYDDIDENSELTDNESQELLALIKNLNQQITILGKNGISKLKLRKLRHMGSPISIIEILEFLIKSGHKENEVILTFLSLLLESDYKKHIDRKNIRICLWVYKQTLADKNILNKMKPLLSEKLKEKAVL